MALPLTTQQQDYVDELDANASAFKHAVIQAFKADNDPDHKLGDATARAATLQIAWRRLVSNLGTNPDAGGSFYALGFNSLVPTGGIGAYVTRVDGMTFAFPGNPGGIIPRTT